MYPAIVNILPLCLQCVFNDDVQGTAATAVGGLYGAMAVAGKPASGERRRSADATVGPLTGACRAVLPRNNAHPVAGIGDPSWAISHATC